MPWPLPKPQIVDAHSREHRALGDRVFGDDPMIVVGPGITCGVDERGRYVLKLTAAPASALAGWHFESKIEVDPTRFYPAQTVIHIQPTHALVTTGIRDAANPSGSVITSCAGFWVATQDVPAQTSVGGHDVWNLPQWPLPVPTNFDDPQNFWLYLGEMDCGL